MKSPERTANMPGCANISASLCESLSTSMSAIFGDSRNPQTRQLIHGNGLSSFEAGVAESKAFDGQDIITTPAPMRSKPHKPKRKTKDLSDGKTTTLRPVPKSSLSALDIHMLNVGVNQLPSSESKEEPLGVRRDADVDELLHLVDVDDDHFHLDTSEIFLSPNSPTNINATVQGQAQSTASNTHFSEIFHRITSADNLHSGCIVSGQRSRSRQKEGQQQQHPSSTQRTPYIGQHFSSLNSTPALELDAISPPGVSVFDISLQGADLQVSISECMSQRHQGGPRNSNLHGSTSSDVYTSMELFPSPPPIMSPVDPDSVSRLNSSTSLTVACIKTEGAKAGNERGQQQLVDEQQQRRQSLTQPLSQSLFVNSPPLLAIDQEFLDVCWYTPTEDQPQPLMQLQPQLHSTRCAQQNSGYSGVDVLASTNQTTSTALATLVSPTLAAQSYPSQAAATTRKRNSARKAKKADCINFAGLNAEPHAGADVSCGASLDRLREPRSDMVFSPAQIELNTQVKRLNTSRSVATLNAEILDNKGGQGNAENSDALYRRAADLVTTPNSAVVDAHFNSLMISSPARQRQPQQSVKEAQHGCSYSQVDCHQAFVPMPPIQQQPNDPEYTPYVFPVLNDAGATIPSTSFTAAPAPSAYNLLNVPSLFNFVDANNLAIACDNSGRRPQRRSRA
jgi:hypothetical protein